MKTIKSAEEILHSVAGDIYRDQNLTKAMEAYHSQFSNEGKVKLTHENNYRHKLFNYMKDEHDISLLDSDFNEIENIINPKKYPYKMWEGIPDPAKDESTSNWGKIKDHDKWLKDLRGDETPQKSNAVELNPNDNDIEDKWIERLNKMPDLNYIEEDDLWNEILNVLGYGYVNRIEFIAQASKQFSITRKQ